MSKDTADYTSQLVGSALNPGYYMPGDKLDRMWHPVLMEVGTQAGAYALMKDQNLPDYVKYTIPTLTGMIGAGGGYALNKYAKNLNIKSPFLNDLLR